VIAILGDDAPATVSEACNWPDAVRNSAEWKWSAPQHYVNIPRDATHYDRQRDCVNGLCITEAIRKYAAELARPELGRERRWQAFAWVCHLVGDLHQPLHAGFRDDRGGNLVDVSYRGQAYTLHEFWDGVLLERALAAGVDPAAAAAPRQCDARRRAWNPASVDAWTDESHAIAASSAYPPAATIGEDFAEKSWTVAQQQLRRATCRLATILNAELGDSGLEAAR
jgi:hypothetical protein